MERATTPETTRTPAGAELIHALTLVAVNAVPVVMALTGGLLPVDVIILFWIEGVATTFVNSALLLRHRAATRKLGHFMVGRSSQHSTQWQAGSQFAHYLFGSLLLHLIYAVFFAIMVAVMVQGLDADAVWGPQSESFRTALGWMAGIMLGEFVLDLLLAGRRPMAWMIRRTSASVGRFIAVHVFLIFGCWAVMVIPWQTAALVVLVVCKTGADLLIYLATGYLRRERDEDPAWLLWLLRDKSKTERERELIDWRELQGDMREHLQLAEEALSPMQYRRALRDPGFLRPRFEALVVSARERRRALSSG